MGDKKSNLICLFSLSERLTESFVLSPALESDLKPTYVYVFIKVFKTSLFADPITERVHKVSEYDQKMPQSQPSGNTIVLLGRDTL